MSAPVGPVQPVGPAGHVVPPAKTEGDPKSITLTPAQLEERLARERAKFADYDTLKAAADELAALKDSQKTAEQRTADRMAALEAQLAATNLAALRARVQATHKIDNADAELFLTGTTADQLEAQAKRLAERTSGPGSNYVPSQGRIPTATDSEDRALVRKLFGNG